MHFCKWRSRSEIASAPLKSCISATGRRRSAGVERRAAGHREESRDRRPARSETQDAPGRPGGRQCVKQINGGLGRGPTDSGGQPGERNADPADAGGAGPGTAGRGMCRRWRERARDGGSVNFSELFWMKSEHFSGGARRGYATGLECATINTLSGFSSVSCHRNLGAPSL